MTERFNRRGFTAGPSSRRTGSWFGTFTDPRYTGNIALIYTTPTKARKHSTLLLLAITGAICACSPCEARTSVLHCNSAGFRCCSAFFRARGLGVDEQDSRGTIFARVGDEFTVALPAASSDATLTEWTVNQPAQGVVVEGVSGSGNGTTFSSDFSLRAAKPGRVQLVFPQRGSPRKNGHIFFRRFVIAGKYLHRPVVATSPS